MFDGAQKSLPSTTSRDDCHGTCETLRSDERQGPTDSEPVELANSTTPLILYRLQKESNELHQDMDLRDAEKMPDASVQLNLSNYSNCRA